VRLRLRRAFLTLLLVTAPLTAGPALARAQLPLLPLPPRAGYEAAEGETLLEWELLVRVLGPPGDRWGAYGAFAQRSLWDVDNSDDPFRVETNFRPEAGWLVTPGLARRAIGAWPDALSLAASFVHESNGLEEQLSRGWNRAVGTLLWRTERSRLQAALTLWKGFRVEPTNDDLARYAGDGEGILQWHLGEGGLLPAGSRLRLRSRFSFDAYHGRFFTNFEATALVRPAFLPRSLLPGRDGPGLDLLLQWFVGTGEMLQHFRNHENRLRVGLALGLGVRD
jgi:outer membrane phospholipase A